MKKLFNDIQKHKKEQEALDIKKQAITSRILEEATSILEAFKDFNTVAYQSFIGSLGVTAVDNTKDKEEIENLKAENKRLKAKIASLETMIKAFNNTKEEVINKDKENITKGNKEEIKEEQKKKKTRRSKRKENNENQHRDREAIKLLEPEILKKKGFSDLYSYKCEAVDEKERYIRGYYQDVPFSIGIKNSSIMIFDINNQNISDEIYQELRGAGLVEQRSVCTDPFRISTPYGVVELASNDSYIGFVVDHNSFITLFSYKEGSSKKVACCGLPSFMESKDLFHNCHDKEVNELAFKLINKHKSSMGLPLIDNTKEEVKENNTKEEINSENTKEQENTKDEIIEETNDKTIKTTNDNITEETNDEEWNEEDEWNDWEADEMLRQQVAQSAEEYYKRRADKMGYKEYEEQDEGF